MSLFYRTPLKKLKILLRERDVRVTDGPVYSEVRPGDFSSYYPVEKYIVPMQPPAENVYDIRTFGAVPDYAQADNAAAINRCIAAASETGGTVLVQGGVYTAKTLLLKSNVTLFIDASAAIEAHRSGQGFARQALVWGQDLQNITITGGGKICGNGNFFGRQPLYRANLFEPAPVLDAVRARRDYRCQIRFVHPDKYGSLLHLSGCRDIAIHNIIFENSARWTCRLDDCAQVKIYDFVINNNRNVANADGIDLVGGRDVDIRHCFISTADDGIVLKNAVWEGSRAPMENIRVHDCEVISRTNAFKIGTETTHDIRNILVEDCRFFMTDLYPGSVSAVSLEACDGTRLSDVRIQNIECDRCACPVFIRLGNRNRAKYVDAVSASAVEYGRRAKKVQSGYDFRHRSAVENISVQNLYAKGAEMPVIIAGYRQGGHLKRVQNVTLSHVHIEYAPVREVVDRRLFIPEYAHVYPEANRFRNLPAYALWARHVQGLSLRDFTCKPAPQTWKKEIILKDVHAFSRR